MTYTWRSRAALPVALAAAALGALVAGCGNPAVDARLTALGEEKPGVEPSEFHRPGQPCVLCHSKYEGAHPEISVGGTIFGSPAKVKGELPVAVENAVVTLTDAEGVVRTATTNCAGNFFLTKEMWNPSFPLRVEVAYQAPGGDVGEMRPAPPMSSRINRDGSCGSCHNGLTSQGSPGFVFCEEAPEVPFKPPLACGGVQ